MHTKPVCYLAGPISGLSYVQATAWRLHMASELQPDFEVLSPMRGKENLNHVTNFNGEYVENVYGSSEAIMQRDLTDVGRADLVIAYFNPGHTLSIGTPFELGYAVRDQKPIIVVTDTESPYASHPFLLRMPKLVLVHDFKRAVLLARSLFNFI